MLLININNYQLLPFDLTLKARITLNIGSKHQNLNKNIIMIKSHHYIKITQNLY